MWERRAQNFVVIQWLSNEKKNAMKINKSSNLVSQVIGETRTGSSPTIRVYISVVLSLSLLLL